MKVTLINYTSHALETLLYTKDTRLQSENTLTDIMGWSNDKKLEHLAYMRDTIQSSWEFVDYTFKISGVTRAFTHQLVRTRQGSYAQESQRTVEKHNAEVINTFQPGSAFHHMYDFSQDVVMAEYHDLLDAGAPQQDARGLLPTNISTSIIAKFDLRTLHNMALLRLCTRTQGEYQRVFKEMVRIVTDIHPWTKDFLKVHCAWYGVCAFPRYDSCPVKLHFDQPTQAIKDRIEQAWEECNHEAVPVAKNGRTM